jgi:hypothetical protein
VDILIMLGFAGILIFAIWVLSGMLFRPGSGSDRPHPA